MKTYHSTDLNRKNLLISFIFLVFLIITGAVLNYFIPNFSVELPKFPYNISIITILTSLLCYVYFHFKKTKFIIWLSGSSAAFSAIISYSASNIFKILGNSNSSAIIISESKNTSLLSSDWVLLLLLLFLLTTLTLSIVSRLYPFNTKYISFLLIHIGIWIVFISSIVYPTDLKTLSLNLLEKSDRTNIAVLPNETILQLPFDIQLLDFTIQDDPLPPNYKYYLEKLPIFREPIKPGMSSSVVISKDSTQTDTILLSGFRSIHSDGWNLYQKGFDENKGKASTLSIIKIQNESWIKSIYLGLVLMFTGLILHLIIESIRKIWIQ